MAFGPRPCTSAEDVCIFQEDAADGREVLRHGYAHGGQRAHFGRAFLPDHSGLRRTLGRFVRGPSPLR